ncbi:hypothetical protein GCM10023238_20940 [Streptomyces heliomycini]
MKKLVKRCCGQDDVPGDLRSKVMGRLDLIRSGQAVPDQDVTAAPATPAGVLTLRGSPASVSLERANPRVIGPWRHAPSP